MRELWGWIARWKLLTLYSEESEEAGCTYPRPFAPGSLAAVRKRQQDPWEQQFHSTWIFSKADVTWRGPWVGAGGLCLSGAILRLLFGSPPVLKWQRSGDSTKDQGKQSALRLCISSPRHFSQGGLSTQIRDRKSVSTEAEVQPRGWRSHCS